MKKGFIRIFKSLNISGRDAVGLFLSLLLAFGIWLIHNLSQNYTEIIPIYVFAVSNISEHSGESSAPVEMNIKCRTGGFDIIRLRKYNKKRPAIVEFAPEDLHAMDENLYYVTGGEMSRYIRTILGSNVSESDILTDTLVFRFEPEPCKRVPVTLLFALTQENFRSQYIRTGDLVVSPDSVDLHGDPEMLKNIDEVETEMVFKTDLCETVEGSAKIKMPKGVKWMSEDAVRYRMDIDRYVEIPAIVPVSTKNVPSGSDLFVYPPTAKVYFRCAFPVREKSCDKVMFYIDYEEFEKSPNGKCLVKNSALPEGVYGFRIEPQVFDCVEAII